MEDFLYICDDAYKREELISTEASILQTLAFDINIPIPYRFLRRYAKVTSALPLTPVLPVVCRNLLCVLQCVKAGMDTLTLARYYCEMSLMHMELVAERGSLVASACLLMALLTKDLGGWVRPVARPLLPPSGRMSVVAWLSLAGLRFGAEKLFSKPSSSFSLPPDPHPAVPLRLPEGRFGAGRQEAPWRPVGSSRRQTESHQEQILAQVRKHSRCGDTADLLQALTLRTDLFRVFFEVAALPLVELEVLEEALFH